MKFVGECFEEITLISFGHQYESLVSNALRIPNSSPVELGLQ